MVTAAVRCGPAYSPGDTRPWTIRCIPCTSLGREPGRPAGCGPLRVSVNPLAVVRAGYEHVDVLLGHGLGMAEQLLARAIEVGQLTPQPVQPLAALLLAAIDEAAMMVAVADDASVVSPEVGAAMHNLIDGVLRPSPEAPPRSYGD